MPEIETSPDVENDEASKYIDGIVSRDDNLLILLGLDKLLTEAKWGQIAEL